MNDDLACFAYSATEYAVFSLSKKTVIEVTMPLPLSAPSSTMGALTGFSGYMTLGLGAKSKPGIVKLNEAESLIIKDSALLCYVRLLRLDFTSVVDEGIIIGKDAKPSRSETIGWQAPPEEIGSPRSYTNVTAVLKLICSIHQAIYLLCFTSWFDPFHKHRSRPELNPYKRGSDSFFYIITSNPNIPLSIQGTVQTILSCACSPAFSARQCYHSANVTFFGHEPFYLPSHDAN